MRRFAPIIFLVRLSGCDLLVNRDGLISGDAGGNPGDDGGGRCSNPRGPMVDLGTFCIDATEVTQAQYQQFLAAKAGDTSGQSAACALNSTWSPGSDCRYDPPSFPKRPVECVDWCDAFAYCAWAGKRLCGGRGGGPVPRSRHNDPAGSEWFYACSKGGQKGYPYGTTFNAASCNIPNSGRDASVDVGSLKSCEGGFDGLFDFSGNVREWEDSCVLHDAGAQDDECRVRGGSFKEDSDVDLACSADILTFRNSDWLRRGIRCCSDR